MKAYKEHSSTHFRPFPSPLSRQLKLPVLPRAEAIYALNSILPLNSSYRVLNVVGPEGGEGKTWALRGLQEYCEDNSISYNKSIIDFYDTAHQRVSGVQTSIIAALDPEGEHFGTYWDRRKKLNELQAQGFGGPALAPLRRERNYEFLKCLRTRGQESHRNGKRSIVLFFDTWEIIPEGHVGSWLLDEFLHAAPSIAVVIAGRPMILPERAGASILIYQPAPFSENEVMEYVRATMDRHNVFDPEVVQRLTSRVLWASNGLPVLVALALDIIHFSLQNTDVHEPFDWNKVLSVLSGHSRETIEQDLVKSLLDQLEGTPELLWALLYMAHFRRRFNKDIYAYLRGQPAGSTSLLESFRELYIVKYRELGSVYRLTHGEPVEVSALLHDRIREDVLSLIHI